MVQAVDQGNIQTQSWQASITGACSHSRTNHPSGAKKSEGVHPIGSSSYLLVGISVDQGFVISDIHDRLSMNAPCDPGGDAGVIRTPRVLSISEVWL